MRRRFVLALVLATGVVIGGNLPLVTGQVAPIWDADTFYCPYYTLVADHARAGRLLLWNPWLKGGSPDCVEPQVGAFSPVVVAMGWLTGGSEAGFRAYWLALWWLGALGMTCLAFHLRAPTWGAILAAVGFVSSGFFTGHGQHTSFIHSMAWLPFMVWRLDVALEQRRFCPGAQAGAVWGLAALGGYPGVTILSYGFLGLWAGGRWWTGMLAARRRVGEEVARLTLPRTLGLIAVMTVVGVLVLAPTYLAFFTEGASYSYRAGKLSREMAVDDNALEPGALATFASPYMAIFKLEDFGGVWPRTSVSSCSIYVVAAVLVLALAAPLARPRDPWRWWLLGLALFFLAGSLGSVLPVRGWLYDLLPPMRFFRHASIFRGYFLFALCLLALPLCRDLAWAAPRRRSHGYRLAALSGFFLSALALAAMGLAPRYVERLGQGYAQALLLTGGFWCASTAVLILGWRTHLTRRTLAPVLITFLALFDAGFAIAISRPITAWTGPKGIETWRRLDRLHVSSLDLGKNGLERRVRYGNDRHNRSFLPKIPVLNGYAPLGNTFFLLWRRKPELVKASTGRDRFWFSPVAAEVAVSRSCFQRFAQRVEQVGAPVMVVHEPRRSVDAHRKDGDEESCAVAELPAAEKIGVEVITYEPNVLTLRFDAPVPGWLLLTEQFARGWRGWLDGEEVRVWKGGFIFRAVRVGAGESTLELRYRPFGFPGLVWLSWATLLVVSIAPAIRGAVARYYWLPR